MQLQIEGQVHRFTPIKNFREMFDLPLTFGIPMFDSKNFTGLGQIESAGAAELNVVRQAVLDAIPDGDAIGRLAHLLAISGTPV